MRASLPDFDFMTPEQLARWRAQPRQCKGPCRRMLTNGDYQITSANGRPTMRGKCPECLAAYYRGYAEKKRRSAGRKPRYAPHQLRAWAKLTGMLSVVQQGDGFEVRRTTSGAKGEKSKLVATCLSEQEAERLVKELREVAAR